MTDFFQNLDYMQLLYAFLVGGILCLIGQILIDKTKLTPARILVIYVTTGAILGGLGIYKYLVDFAGAGATIPISGFGYLLAKGAKEGAKISLFKAITGGITSAGIGITSAIVFGYIFSLIFHSRSKKN